MMDLLRSDVFVSYEGTFIGFSQWPKIILGSLIVMTMFGLFQYHIHDNKVRRRFNDRFLAILAGIFTCFLWKALMDEIGEALVKWFDLNALTAYDSSAWSVILMVFTIGFVSAFYGALIFQLGKTIGQKKRINLHRSLKNVV